MNHLQFVLHLQPLQQISSRIRNLEGLNVPRAAMMLAFRTAIGFSLSYTNNQRPSDSDSSSFPTLKALLPELLAVKAVAMLNVCFSDQPSPALNVELSALRAVYKSE